LFDYPRREALWDSVVVGKMAEWIMLLEEQGVEGEYVPGDKRCKGVDIVDFNLVLRRAQVRCLVPNSETVGWSPRETVIAW